MTTPSQTALRPACWNSESKFSRNFQLYMNYGSRVPPSRPPCSTEDRIVARWGALVPAIVPCALRGGSTYNLARY